MFTLRLHLSWISSRLQPVLSPASSDAETHVPVFTGTKSRKGDVHFGVDNLGVVRHVGSLLSGCRRSKPFELVDDGDLLLLIYCILQRRGLDTVCVSKVKGHADDGMVQRGQVRREDR